MASCKRASDSPAAKDTDSKKVKRTVTRKTIEGWISQYDKEFHTIRWLDF